MKKKRLNWRKIWRRHTAWFDKEEEETGNATWERQRKKLVELVENDRNEKPRERKK